MALPLAQAFISAQLLFQDAIEPVSGRPLDPRAVAAVLQKNECEICQYAGQWGSHAFGGVGVVVSVDGHYRAPDARAERQQTPTASQLLDVLSRRSGRCRTGIR